MPTWVFLTKILAQDLDMGLLFSWQVEQYSKIINPLEFFILM